MNTDLRYYRRLYDPNGSFIRSELYNPVEEMVKVPPVVNNKLHFINADAQLSIEPAYREQTVRGTHYLVNELIPMGSFPPEAFNGLKPIYWQGTADVQRENRDSDVDANANTNEPFRRSLRNVFNGDSCLRFSERAALSLAAARYVQSPNVLLRQEPELEIEFSFEFKMRPRVGSFRVDVLVAYQITCGRYYLSADPLHWQLGDARNSIFVGVDDYDQWKTYQITIPRPPEDGDFSVKFFQPVYFNESDYPNRIVTRRSEQGSTSHSGTLLIDTVSARLRYGSIPPEGDTSITEVNSSRYTLVPDPEQITHADVPPYRNAHLIYPYAWRVKDELTKEWRRYGYPESALLIDLNLQALVDANAQPTRRITGTLCGSLLPHQYVVIVYDKARLYKVSGFEWDVRFRDVAVDLMQVLGTGAVQPIYQLTEDGLILLSEPDSGPPPYQAVPLLIEKRR